MRGERRWVTQELTHPTKFRAICADRLDGAAPAASQARQDLENMKIKLFIAHRKLNVYQ